MFLDLDLFQLLGQLARERLELLPVVDVLLQLVADQFAVLFGNLLLLQQLPFQLPQVVQLLLLLLMLLCLLVVGHLGR